MLRTLEALGASRALQGNTAVLRQLHHRQGWEHPLVQQTDDELRLMDVSDAFPCDEEDDRHPNLAVEAAKDALFEHIMSSMSAGLKTMNY